MKTVKGVFVKGGNPFEAKRHELRMESYRDYYPLLACETFDIQTRHAGAYAVDIYCDDEALFKENPIPSAITVIDGQIEEILCGNLFFVSHNSEGDTVSLSDEACEAVLQSKALILYEGEIYEVIRLSL